MQNAQGERGLEQTHMSYMPHIDLAPLGTFLRRAREAARLSIKEFAFALDYSPTHLCDIENGRRRVTRPLCDDLSDKLGLDRSELYARAGHLSDEVLNYLVRRPRALRVLELLAERDVGDERIASLCDDLNGADPNNPLPAKGHAATGDPSEAFASFSP